MCYRVSRILKTWRSVNQCVICMMGDSPMNGVLSGNDDIGPRSCRVISVAVGYSGIITFNPDFVISNWWNLREMEWNV